MASFRFRSLAAISDGKSPLTTDTIIIILIQGSYFLLSRKFLTSALPTLRQISRAPDSVETSDLTSDLLDGGDDSPRLSHDHRSSNTVFVNASGGISEPASPSKRESLALPGGRKPSSTGALPYDSDDSDSYSYAGSPAPGTPSEEIEMPILPVFASDFGGHSRRQSRGDETGEALGKKLTDSAPSKRRVLRVFNTSRSGKRSEEQRGKSSRVSATKGLGRVATNLFSLLFSESLLLLTLVMFHAAGILHDRSRRIHFSFALHFILLLILFVVPLVQCLQLTYRAREPSSQIITPRRSLTMYKRLLISLVPFSLYIFLFTRIPPYITTIAPSIPSTTFNSSSLTWSKGFPSSVELDLDDLPEDEELHKVPGMDDDDYANQEGWQKGGWLEPSLGRVLACGVVVLGGLSGLGAVRTSWNFIEAGGLSRGGRRITREDIISAERSLYRVRHDLVARRETLNAGAGGATNPDGSTTPAPYNPTWVGRVFGNTFGGDREFNALRREIDGLEAVEGQIARSLEAMQLRKKRQNFARTFRGRIFNIVAYIFAAYCIARIVICLTSVFFPPLATGRVAHDSLTGEAVKRKGNTNGDWISFFIAWGLSQLPNGFVDVNRASRAISLLLTGLLILSSLAQVLRSVSRILRLTSKSIGAGFLLLGLGQLMATYAISLLIQLRSSLPPAIPEDALDSSFNSTDTLTYPATVHDPSLLATLPDFRIFGRLFDVMFLLAAFGTAIYRYAGHKMNGADDFGYVYH